MFIITGGYYMNINFELYRIFYTVANHGNITKASEELLISQPAISKSIKNLEEQLGGTLFVRTKRGVILTEEGKEFYKYIKQAMEFIQNAESKFTDMINLETGTIKIGISTTLTKEFLLPYIEIFHSKYPNINIEITTNITNELIPKLRNGLIDMIILNLAKNHYGDDIDILNVKEIHDCFICNKSYKELLNRKVSIKELASYPLILLPKGANTRTFVDNLASNYGVTLKPNIELASIALNVEFARIGLGISYVTKEYITKYLTDEELCEIDLLEDIPPRYIGIATSKNHVSNFSSKKLIEIITNKKEV